MPLSLEEKERYSRHLNLPQFGMDAQEKLRNSSVLVVGTGGLGAPLLQYLTAAGVGRIGVVDFDIVDHSNLQRQVLFTVEDIGKPKTSTAIDRLSRQNPHVTFEEHRLKLTSENALEIIERYDVVADGTDNFQTRYLVNDACVLLNKPNVYASIFQFEGQVSVFNYSDDTGTAGPNYRDLFPSPPPPGMVPSCAEGGVLGVLPGIVGSLQAVEVIKVLTGIGDVLSGRLFLFDALSFVSRTVKIGRDPENPLTGERPEITELIDYDEFCGIKGSDIQQVSVEELKGLIKSENPFVLIDVREKYEYEAADIGGILIPVGEVEGRLEEIPRDVPVVIHCKSGARSAAVISLLRDKYGYANLRNLTGGILAWKSEFEPDMVVI